MVKKECEVCARIINLKKDKYVLLGTYTGREINAESYFHFHCFKEHWERQVRLQAQNTVNKMAKNMMPIAKKLVGGFVKS